MNKLQSFMHVHLYSHRNHSSLESAMARTTDMHYSNLNNRNKSSNNDRVKTDVIKNEANKNKAKLLK